MPTDAKLDICVDVLNEALQVKDIACAQKILQKMELFGYKEDAEGLKKDVWTWIDIETNPSYVKKGEKRHPKG
eukprot:CAMPEP_0184030304 /NCGR_PEP_ID=MMETSP0955-20130417/1335_1 /TAXON_ID=627963 /ORGANISM="Aplanochytrium sp, Strain PBS07" /LENGTH=72 /DNA_ID=CAMNT_0026315639 /DNA_START=182 /DNA_END=400 /DNA_ORIENTATION=+